MRNHIISTLPVLIRTSAALLVLTAMHADQSTAFAQKGKSKSRLVTVKGKVVKVEKAGRRLVLTVEDNLKNTTKYRITARVEFAVTAKGDDGFLAVNRFVSARPQTTNNRLFAKKFTVHLVSGKKPRSSFGKAEARIGESTNTWAIAGSVISRQQDKDYPDYETVTLRVGGKKGTPVYLDKGYSVTVSSTDPGLIILGSVIVLEGKPLKKGQLTLVRATVTLSKPLSSKDFIEKSGKK